MNNFEELRKDMVNTQIIPRGISDPKVLEAMLKVERHLFVSEEMQDMAYNDNPLPIGEGQTISQPYIVAFMSEILGLTKTDKVLEIGTGAGYQTAILAELAREVYSVEIIESLQEKVKFRLKEYSNIKFMCGDGHKGWPEYAPFDAVIVTCAASALPQALIRQIAGGGRMIIPVGEGVQKLMFLRKEKNNIKSESVMSVVFVPMVKEIDN